MSPPDWQESTGPVTDPARFAVQDNHAGFVVGAWPGGGLLLLAGSFAAARFRTALIAMYVLVFVGGLMRIASGDTDTILSVQVLPSMLAELVLFPVLGFWLFRTQTGTRADARQAPALVIPALFRHIEPEHERVHAMGSMVPFAKMNGLGNDIVVIDMRGRSDAVTAEAAIALASGDRTGFDQIMAIHDTDLDGVDYRIDILNRDGSHSQACGNGTRCVVQALASETGRKSYTFKTLAGILTAEEHEDGLISVDMGVPEFRWDRIPLAEEFYDTTRIELQVGPIDAPVLHSPSVMSIGNPHAIFWVKEDVWSYDLERFGPLLENHPIFPERANISIARVRDAQTLDLRTWERGAGLTRACGSAACAAAVCAARTDRTGRTVTVNVPGGPLLIDWRASNHVIMTGPAEWEFSGTVDPVTGDWKADEAAA